MISQPYFGAGRRIPEPSLITLIFAVVLLRGAVAGCRGTEVTLACGPADLASQHMASPGRLILCLDRADH
jgi:hypothetical protein